MNRSDAIELALEVVAVARERRISVTAAGLAYHAFNTLVPLIILLLVGVTIVDALEPVIEALETAGGAEAGATRDELDRLTGDGGRSRLRASIIALAIFAWSAVRLFQAVNSAFTGVYGTRKRQTFVGATSTLALIVATVVVGVTLVAGVGVALALFVDGVGASLLTPPLLIAALVVAFLPMYYFFPHADVSVREVLPGTLFAAVGWTILGLGFQLYVATSESVDLFGLAGAVLILLTWVYLGGACLVIGAVLNAVLADRVEADEEWLPLGIPAE
ncbi:YihY/virulence factor BrkB family protein [Halovivax sp.]|uniref:YihY/virulence factor BrkB family protein n=1 Tax=Halovivax sp. TaxID=1935978 RepID=UPI0025B97456|nr:YihY/virulence factor BrkB family protein [Halovivax sp.]